MNDSRSSTSLVITGTFTILSQIELTYALSVSQSITGSLSVPPTLSGTLTLPAFMESQYKDVYDDEIIFTPSWEDQTIETKDKIIKADMLIKPIQTYETSNEFGTTFII